MTSYVVSSRGNDKERLFQSLEVFFSEQDDNDDRNVQSLRESYLLAKESGSNESYVNLVEELYKSSLTFPEFIVQCRPHTLGNELLLFFLTERVDKKNDFLPDDDDDDDDETESLSKSSDEPPNKTEKPDAMTRELIRDSFSFIMCRPRSRAAFIGWVIFLIQTITFFMFAFEDLDNHRRGVRRVIPKGVPTQVQVGQVIAILVNSFMQEGFWESINHFLNGYPPELLENGISFRWWWISILARLSDGIISTGVTFLLIIHAENNIDLFKEFTAMTFISSLDDIVYELAHSGFLSLHMKRVAEKVESIEISSTVEPPSTSKTLREYISSLLYRPLTFIGFLMIIMYSFWFSKVLIPQRNGEFLCQKLYIQFDDGIDPTLSYFSGEFKHIKNTWDRTYPLYTESRNPTRNPSRPMKLKSSGSGWEFIIKDTVVITTEGVENQAAFDITEVTTEWSVSGQLGGLPKKDLRISCIDEDSPPDLSEICAKILIDERDTDFISTRKWSRSFQQLTDTKVYDKAVYYSYGENKQGLDLIFFVGKRWILVSSTTFTDLTDEEKNDKMSISTYLGNMFHAYWSLYEPDFFSEQIVYQTPEDTLMPLDRKWFKATKKKSKISDELVVTVDVKKDVESTLICAFCNFTACVEGDCIHNICQCHHGSNGTLCQILPTGNGFCDTHFNKLAYDFDGGDCCAYSCKPNIPSDNFCGFHETKNMYVGFDNCTKSTDDNVTWKIEPANLVKDKFVIDFALSENAQFLTSIEPTIKNAHIEYVSGIDLVPVMAGPLNIVNENVDTIQISCNRYYLSSQKGEPPITIALSDSRNIYIHDYSFNRTIVKGIYRFHQLPFTNDESKIIKFMLKNSGNSLAVFFDSNRVSWFSRQHYSLNFTLEENFENKRGFSLSSNGDRLVLFNDTAAEIKFLLTSRKETINFPESNKLLQHFAVSPDGNHILFAGDSSEQSTLTIYVCTYWNETFTDPNNNMTRINYQQQDTIHIQNSGRIFIHSLAENNLVQIKPFYYEVISKVDATKILFSEDENLFVSLCRENVQLWYRHPPIKNNDRTLGLSFFVDKPQEFVWKLVLFKSKEDVTVLQEGEPYDEDNLIYYNQITVPDDSCIGIEIYALGMTGFNPPTVIAIRERNEIKAEITSTNGFLNVFNVVNHTSCVGDFQNYIDSFASEPYNESRHGICFMNHCSWNSTEDIVRGDVGAIQYESFIRLSSDGSVLAISNYVVNNVTIYKYNKRNGKWEALGKSLSGVKTEDQFGYSISLSATGKTIAITSSEANYTDQAWSGQVHIFDFEIDEWKPRVVQKNFENELRGDKRFVSISADGLFLAVGIRINEEEKACVVKVYKYSKNLWTQHGDCVFSNAYGSAKVWLSSTGNVLAVQTISEITYFGSVQIFKFQKFRNVWDRMGNEFKGIKEKQFLGISLSLSADGSVLAFGGQITAPSKVYQYDHISKEWTQRGQEIPLLTEGLYYAVSLSASGDVWVIGQVSTVRVYVYDKAINRWIKGRQDINLGVPFSKVNPDEIAVVESSADLLTIATMVENNKVRVYRLNQLQDSNCAHESLFNFTIKPDRFPRDILWSLTSVKGDRVLGGKTLSSDAKETFTLCLNNERDGPFTFQMIDSFKDGICCKYGDGYFSLHWGDKEMNQGSKFETNITQCVPFDQNNILSITFPKPADDVTWSIYNSSNNALQKYSAIEQNTIEWCYPADKYLIFRVHSWRGNGAEYTLKFGNNTHQRGASEKYFFSGEVISFGDVRKYQTFGLDLGTDDAVRLIYSNFTWKVFHSSLTNKPFFEGGVVLEEHKNNYHIDRLVPDKTRDCLYVRLFDIPGPATKQYGLWRDHYNLLDQGNHSSLLTTFEYGKECNSSCPANQVFFSLDLLTGNNASQFNWTFLDSYRPSKVRQRYSDNTYYFFGYCVPVPLNGCKILKLRNGIRSSETYYSVSWNGTLVKENQMNSTEVEIKMGNCNLAPVCSGTNESLVSIYIILDKRSVQYKISNYISWKLKKEGDKSWFREGGNYSTGQISLYDEMCINESMVTDCFEFFIMIDYDGYRTAGFNPQYGLSLNGNLIRQDNIYAGSQTTFFGNCF